MAEAKIRLSVDGATASVASLQSVSGAMSTLDGRVKDLVGGLVGGVSAGAFAMWLKSAVDTADSMNDLSKSTDIAVGKLAGLKLSAQQSGSDLNETAKSINKLQLEIGRNAEKFAAIGITAKDGIGAFKQLADIYKGIEDPQLRAAVAAEALGKSWAGAAPLLSEGSAKIQEMIDKGELLSGMNQTAADAADEFNDRLVELQTALGGAALKIAADLLPLITTLTEDLTDTATAANGLESEFSPLAETMRAFIITGGNVAFVLKGIGAELGGLAAQAAAVARGDFAQAVTIGREMKADAEGARKAFDAWEQKMMSAGKTAKATATVASAATKELTAAQQAALKDFAAKPASDAKNAAAAKAAAARKKELAELAKAEADALAIVQKVADARQAAYLKESNAIDAFMLSLTESASASLKSVNDRIKSLKDEEEAARLAAALNITLAESVERVAIARLQEKQAGFVTGSEGYAAIEREIEARQKLTGLIAGSEARKAAQESAKDAAKNAETEWQKAADQINQSLSDALFDAFQSGEDFGKTFVKSITSMFNSMVLKPVISAIVTPVAGAVTGSLGLSGTANAATGGSSLFSSAGSLGSLYNTLNTSTAMGGLFASNAAYGAAIGTTNIAAGSQAALLAAQTGEFGLAGLTGTAGAAGSTLAGLAAAAPYIAAFVAAAYLLDKYVVGQATPHSGGGSQYSAAGGTKTTGTWVPETTGPTGYWGGDQNNSWWVDTGVQTTPGYMTGSQDPGFAGGFTSVGYSQAAVDMTTALTKGIVSILDSTATAFGEQAGYTAASSFADDSSKDGAWGSLVIANAIGQELVNWRDGNKSYKTFGDGASGAAEYQAAIAADVRGIINSIDLPAWATDMLKALGDAPDLTALSTGVAQINAVAGALKTMGEKLVGFSSMSDATVSALIKAAGGFDALAVSASTYYDNFYSEAERSTFTLTEVAQTLNAVNLNLPTTREGFRALVEAQQALGNAEGVAALLKVSGAFAAVIPVTETLTGTVDDMGQAIGRTAADIANNLRDLNADTVSAQIDQLRAQGLDDLADAKQRATDTQGWTAAEIAIYDYNAGLRQQTDGLIAASDASRDYRQAMASATSSVANEIQRLRGLNVAQSSGGEAYLMAQFATVTGQARAGSVTAMERLPEISQAIESAAALNATSSVDLARTRAWLAGSLSTTAGAPAGEVFGTLPGASGYAGAQSGTAPLEALVQKLTTEVEGLRAEARATATHTSNINRQIERLTPDGDALAVREAAAL